MKIRLLPILLAALLILAGCGPSRPKKRENNERLQELAQEFINDVGNEYLPRKDTPADYTQLPIAVSAQNGSYNIGLLQTFAQKQQDGEDASVTIAFTAGGTVFSRLIYEDDIGYYLRYQYDSKKEGEQLEISAQYFYDTQFSVNEDASSATLTLIAEKTKQVASFSFKNIVTGSKTDTEADGE